MVAAEASAAAVAAVSVHGTGTALGALAGVLHGLATSMKHVVGVMSCCVDTSVMCSSTFGGMLHYVHFCALSSDGS